MRSLQWNSGWILLWITCLLQRERILYSPTIDKPIGVSSSLSKWSVFFISGSKPSHLLGVFLLVFPQLSERRRRGSSIRRSWILQGMVVSIGADTWLHFYARSIVSPLDKCDLKYRKRHSMQVNGIRMHLGREYINVQNSIFLDFRNAESVQRFWQTWNIPVHRWAHRWVSLTLGTKAVHLSLCPVWRNGTPFDSGVKNPRFDPRSSQMVLSLGKKINRHC